jgi:hypothetical protein
MTSAKKSKQALKARYADEQLYSWLHDIHGQLCDARVLLVEMQRVVHGVEAISSCRKADCVRIQRRFAVLIVLVDVALEEIRGYCGFGVEDSPAE